MPRSLQIPGAEKTRGVTKTRRVITRAVAVTVASLCLAAAPRADADEERVAWIGFLANEATPESGPVLRQSLHDRGWVEGQNLKIWNRYAQGKLELFPGHAEELLRVGVHLIVAAGPSATEAARRATTTIPVVVATPDDPVANGLVASSRRWRQSTGSRRCIPSPSLWTPAVSWPTVRLGSRRFAGWRASSTGSSAARGPATSPWSGRHASSSW